MSHRTGVQILPACRPTGPGLFGGFFCCCSGLWFELVTYFVYLFCLFVLFSIFVVFDLFFVGCWLCSVPCLVARVVFFTGRE